MGAKAIRDLNLIRNIVPERAGNLANAMACLQPTADGKTYLVGVGDTASAGVILDMKLEGEGVAIPGKHLGVLEGAREIKQENSALRVVREDGNFTVSGFPGNAWREATQVTIWPERPSAGLRELPSKVGEFLERVSAITAKNEYQGALRGVQLEFSEDELVRIVATDGYLMALVEWGEARVHEGGEIAQKLVIPTSAIRAGLFERAEVSYPQKGSLWLYGPDFWAQTQLIEGEYPNYKRVVPSREGTALMVFSPEEVLEAYERVAAFSEKEHRKVRLTIEDGRGVLEAESLEGKAVTSFPLQEFQGGGEWYVNGQMLARALSVFRGESEQVRWVFHGSFSPTLLEANLEDHRIYAVLAPLRV